MVGDPHPPAGDAHAPEGDGPRGSARPVAEPAGRRQQVGEVELGGTRAHDPERRRRQGDVDQVDAGAQQGKRRDLDVEPLELREGLGPVPVAEAEALDGKSAGEEVEVDVPDGDGPAGVPGNPVQGDAPDDLGQRPQDRPRQETRHGHGDECALEKPTHVDVLTSETRRTPSLARGSPPAHHLAGTESNPVPGTGFGRRDL